MTAHRRLQEWERAGVFDKLHAEPLRRLNGAGQIGWVTSVVDGSCEQDLVEWTTAVRQRATCRYSRRASAVRPFKRALAEDSIPLTLFGVADVDAES